MHADPDYAPEYEVLEEPHVMQAPVQPQIAFQQPQFVPAPAPRLLYKPKLVNFDKAPRQGKLSLAGMLTQISANTLGQMGINDGDRTMVKIATGLQGMGQAMSTINATRDPWGRMKGTLQDQKTYYDKMTRSCQR